ncbi:hypothetical protein GWI33_015803 [Rhynchophorus ferrugineus]|uniref:Ig-like domain-containing protein n=1 Tax=Rhynchophorus ferrugineus TaxID=354439 RepID=A0A834M9C0_RHYFE|nr:hypothetical protein GWI33_015803 [Rhynchophorus ferrugineus]
MGPYLCIASNGVPPSVSKRIMLVIHFPPMVWIKNQLVGAYEGQQVTLECHLEAFPKSINYWINERGEMISQSNGRYEPLQKSHNYKTYMKLKIEHVSQSDYGKYKCIAKNALGETDGTIQLFAIPKPSKLLNGIDNDLQDQAGSLLQDKNYVNTASTASRKFICTNFLLVLSALHRLQ